MTTGLTTTPPGKPRDLRGSGGGLHSPPGSPLPSVVSGAHLGAEKKRGKSRDRIFREDQLTDTPHTHSPSSFEDCAPGCAEGSGTSAHSLLLVELQCLYMGGVLILDALLPVTWSLFLQLSQPGKVCEGF